MTTDDFFDDLKHGRLGTAVVGTSANPNAEKYDEYWTVAVDETTGVSYKLVNTAGTVQNNKTHAKDGDGICFDVSGEKITAVYVEN